MVSSGNEHQPPSRAPIRLLGSVLLLGALLAWWGTRDDRHLFGAQPPPTRSRDGPILRPGQTNRLSLWRTAWRWRVGSWIGSVQRSAQVKVREDDICFGSGHRPGAPCC